MRSDVLLTVFHVIIVLTTLTYAGWQWRNFIWWRAAIEPDPHVDIPQELVASQVAVSLLVPARNEAANLGQLITELLQQDGFGPNDEIIVIDDHSTDSTPDIVRSFGNKVRLLHLSDYQKSLDQPILAHKKAALTYGVQQSSNPLIVTTDADCSWPPDVLRNIRAANEQARMICGPVLIQEPVNDFLSGFQALDLISYTLLTTAYAQAQRPILANGANLSFSRSLFEAVNGYSGIDHLPSGDDVLLLQKVRDIKGATEIRTLVAPASAVTTKAVASWSALWQQRLRWAGKTGNYTNTDLNFAQRLMFLVCLLIVLGIVLGPWHPALLRASLSLWFLKAIIDFWLLRSVCRHFQRSHWLRYYFPAQLIQPFYLVTIGTAALLGLKVTWKGRI